MGWLIAFLVAVIVVQWYHILRLRREIISFQSTWINIEDELKPLPGQEWMSAKNEVREDVEDLYGIKK